MIWSTNEFISLYCKLISYVFSCSNCFHLLSFSAATSPCSLFISVTNPLCSNSNFLLKLMARIQSCFYFSISNKVVLDNPLFSIFYFLYDVFWLVCNYMRNTFPSLPNEKRNPFSFCLKYRSLIMVLWLTRIWLNDDCSWGEFAS